MIGTETLQIYHLVTTQIVFLNCKYLRKDNLINMQYLSAHNIKLNLRLFVSAHLTSDLVALWPAQTDATLKTKETGNLVLKIGVSSALHTLKFWRPRYP